jgi:hypothetical protein
MSPILHARPLLHPWKRNLSTFPTWNSLLFPSAQNSHIVAPVMVNETREEVDRFVHTSSFSPRECTSQRLLSCLHLTKELPYKMHQDLRHIINEHRHCRIRAEGTHTTIRGRTTTPSETFSYLQIDLGYRFNLNYEDNIGSMAHYLSIMVKDIFHALTGKDVVCHLEPHADRNVVVTDLTYKVDDMIKILWDNESFKVFNQLVGKLMDDLRHGSRLEPYPQTVPTKYKSYTATLGKVCVFTCLSSLVSDSCLSIVVLPCNGNSAPGPLGSPVQWTQLRHHLYPSIDRKTYFLLLTSLGLLPQTW